MDLQTDDVMCLSLFKSNITYKMHVLYHFKFKYKFVDKFLQTEMLWRWINPLKPSGTTSFNTKHDASWPQFVCTLHLLQRIAITSQYSLQQMVVLMDPHFVYSEW